jgi:hypothetical protein
MSHVTFILHFFRNSNNVWWQVQIMKLYIMQFTPSSYYFQAYSLRTEHLSKTQSVFPQCHGPSVTPTGMKRLCKHKHTHTSLYFNNHVFRKQERQQNITKHFSVLIFCHLYSLTPLQNTSSSPTYQNFKRCIGQVIFC